MNEKRRRQLQRDLDRAERMLAVARHPTTHKHWSNRVREYREMLETGTEPVRQYAF